MHSDLSTNPGYVLSPVIPQRDDGRDNNSSVKVSIEISDSLQPVTFTCDGKTASTTSHIIAPRLTLDSLLQSTLTEFSQNPQILERPYRHQLEPADFRHTIHKTKFMGGVLKMKLKGLRLTAMALGKSC